MTWLLQQTYDWYHWINYEASDPRVKNYYFMDSYMYPLILNVIYLWFVLKLGPHLMRNRTGFKLKKTLVVYNTIQIIVCSTLVYKAWHNGWSDGTNSLLCTDIDYSMNPKSVRFVYLGYCALITKVLDFLDTVFFVLRKKQSQITFLHLYHHSSTLWMGWISLKYVAGENISLIVMMNLSVHVIMYTYYLLAAFGPEVQSRLKYIKKWITIIQMLQFTIGIIYGLHNYLPMCSNINQLQRTVQTLAIFYASLIYILFYNFYQKTYKKSDTNGIDKKSRKAVE